MNGCLGCILRFVKRFWSPVEEGSIPVVHLAVSSDVKGMNGSYYNEMELYDIRQHDIGKQVLDRNTQNEWMLWIHDFLSRTS